MLGGEWRRLVPARGSRAALANGTLGARIVRALGYAQEYAGVDAVVDMYAGPCVFAGALQRALRPRQYIVMEQLPAYRALLDRVEGPGVYVERDDGYRWNVFAGLEEKGVLRPSTLGFERVHPQLLFTANLMHAQGEQLVTQYINCILRRSWLLKYGRVRLLLWMRPKTAAKILAPVGTKQRARISLLRETVADYRCVLHAPAAGGAPAQFLEPLVPAADVDVRADFTGSLREAALVELTPKDTRVDDVESFEFVIKNLMVRRTTALAKSLDTLGPGAAQHLGPLLPHLLAKRPCDLSVDETLEIVSAFRLWPFKPELLMDVYEDALGSRGLGVETRR